MIRILTIAALAAVLATPATAEMIDASGVGYGKSNNAVTPVTDTITIIHAATEYERFETSAENPMAGFTGPCRGTMTIAAGEVFGSGNCHYTDADGDKAVIKWEADGVTQDGRTQGTWAIVGGSGKWAAATGGGRFDAGENDAEGYTNKVSGEIMLP